MEIFMRLTIRTLLRCTSVCKSWCSLITSPNFVKAHLNWQKASRALLIMRTCTQHSQKEVYSWHSDDVAFSEVGCNSPYDHPYNNYYRILDSCNGVLCLVDDYPTSTEDTSLWNPAIRVWVKLPPQPVTHKPYVELDHATLFGVDSTSDDYKVIRIIYQKKGRKVAPKVLMYTLRSSTWKNVSHLAAGFKHLVIRRSTTQACYNGASHLVVFDKKECRPAILSFHLGNELFHSMELPANVAFTLNNLFENLRPAVFRELFSVVETRSQAMILWTMEQYGVGSSWSKRYEINLDMSLNRIIGFRKNGMFLVDALGRLYSYDPEAKARTERDEQLKNLGIMSRGGYYQNSLHAIGYVESLALLGRQERYF